MAEGVPGDRAAVGARRADCRPPGRVAAARRLRRRRARASRRRPSASRARKTCCRTCSTRRSSSTSRSTGSSTATRPRFRRRTSSTGCSPARRPSIEIERGKTLIVKFLTTGEVREDGTRTVFFELNGQPREVRVADRVGRRRPSSAIPKAEPDNANHIAAPMPGKVSSVAVQAGPDGRSGRAAAVDRGDEDGDGGLQPA